MKPRRELKNCQHFVIPLLPLHGTIQCLQHPQSQFVRMAHDPLEYSLPLRLVTNDSASTNLSFPDFELRFDECNDAGVGR